MAKFTNIFKDGEITTFSPDAAGDFYFINDKQLDHNYTQEKYVDIIRAIGDDTAIGDYGILYGGIVSDGGAGTVDISEGVGFGKDSNNKIKFITLPALTGVSIPSGWNDNRQIWITGVYTEKLGTETRSHKTTLETYHYTIEDSYIGESDSDDLFVDSSPSNVLVWGSFKMNGTTFTDESTGERSDEWKVKGQGSIETDIISIQNNIISLSQIMPIINGNMEIVQRGTSFINVGHGNYCLDRYQHYASGTMTYNVSQDSDVPNSQSQHSLKISITNADTTIDADNYFFFTQKIEGYNFFPFVGKSAILSFKVKSNKTGTYCITFKSGGSDRSYIAEYTISSVNTWEEKEIPITFDYSGGTWDYTNGIGIMVKFVLAMGSNYHTTPDTWQSGDYTSTSNQTNFADNTSNYINFSQIQINEGNIALPFQHRYFGEELSLCQRYCQSMSESLVNNGTYNTVHWANTAQFYVIHHTPMRVSPTFSHNATGIGAGVNGLCYNTAAAYTVSSFSLGYSATKTNTIFWLSNLTSSQNNGDVGQIVFSTAGGAYKFILDAEL